MSPIDNAVDRLRAKLQAERSELMHVSAVLSLARKDSAAAGLVAAYEHRYCDQLDRVWAAQELVAGFNPSFTMVPEPA